MRRFLITMIAAYRYLLSPWLGQNCRFHPSCSCYAQQAIHQHGSVRGLWLAACRIVRCHPWHPGGYDPVPTQPVATPVSHPDSNGNCSHG